MGIAAFKNSKLPLPNQSKNENKNITIGVFGLDDAGKTSIIKAIEGDPTENISPTISSVSTMVINPLNEKNVKNKIKIIDVSGERKFRQKSWSQYYDQIHGLIFVLDASERKRLNENQETLEDLLGNEKLKDKPILILANKQDQKGSISKEHDLKRQLDIEKLKTKYKIELCTALPQKSKNKVDESIGKGFSWLIRTIDDNYIELNARVTKGKNIPMNKKSNRSESDENEKTSHYRSKITSEKLPSININKNQTKLYSDDDDDNHQNYSSSKNELNKKKKVLGVTNTNDRSIKKSNDNEPQAFRSTYESFPEETPWSTSLSMLKTTKNDDTLSRLYAKPSLINDTKKRGVSPLVHDTKSYTNGSSSKLNNISDDEEDYMHQQKLKPTNRFDNSSFSTNRFSLNTKKPVSSIYNNADDNTRRIITASKKVYNDDDDEDEEDNYLKKSTTTKLNKNYDFDENKTYQRSSNHTNLQSDYRGTLTKPGNYSKYDNDNNRASSFSRKDTHSKFDDDDGDNYLTSKPTNRSKYNDDDDDDHRWSSSKAATNSKYDKDDYPSSSSKLTTRPKYDQEDRSFSSSKPISHSKFEDDDYPTSKPTIRSNYNNHTYPISSSKSTGHSKYSDDDDDDDDYHPTSSSKAVTRSKYSDDDDDDDDYPTSSKKNNYPSSYGSNATRSRFDNDDVFNTKDKSSTNNRFRKNTDYDS